MQRVSSLVGCRRYLLDGFDGFESSQRLVLGWDLDLHLHLHPLFIHSSHERVWICKCARKMRCAVMCTFPPPSNVRAKWLKHGVESCVAFRNEMGMLLYGYE